jgi:hypothetical protein
MAIFDYDTTGIFCFDKKIELLLMIGSLHQKIFYLTVLMAGILIRLYWHCRI